MIGRKDREDAPGNEIDDELRSHIAYRADDLVRDGVPRAEAERRARLEFGGLEGYKEQIRDVRRPSSWIEAPTSAVHDLAIAARRLRRSPLFTAFSVVSLAIGVSLTSAVFALVQATLWKQVGVADAASLVIPASQRAGRLQWQAVSRADLRVVSAQQQSFVALGWFESVGMTAALGPDAVDASIQRVSGDLFQVIGVKPALGRLIQPADDRADATPVVVLSHRVWRSVFGSNPAVVGTSLRLQDRTFEVIGVASAAFEGFEQARPARWRIWITAAHADALRAQPDPSLVDRVSVSMLGRLRPDQTVERASAELTRLSAALDVSAPQQVREAGTDRIVTQPRRWEAVSFEEWQDEAARQLSFAAYVIIGVGGLVLLVASTNIANLSLARGASRQHEFAIRRALGASRARLVRELLGESIWIAALGLGLSWLLLRWLLAISTTDLPVSNQQVLAIAPAMDWRVLFFTAACAFGALVVFGIQPALRTTRASDRAILAQSGYSVVGAARGQWRVISAQVAVACAFLIVASIAVRYVMTLSRDDSGLRLDGLAIGTSVFLGPSWPQATAMPAVRSILDQVRLIPGIESAAASTGLPFGMQTTPWVTVRASGEPRSDVLVYRIGASAEILQTLGVSIERGRGLDARDEESSMSVGVLSAKAARQIFGTSDVVGRTVGVAVSKGQASSVLVVGIASDTDVQSRGRRQEGVLYVPLGQGFSPGITFTARAASADVATRALRTAIARADVGVPMMGVGAAEPMLSPALPVSRLASGITLGLGAITLLLAMVGLHGVVAHVLAGRTREMALRMALGATSQQVWSLALRQGLRPVVVGLAAGLFVGTLVRVAARQAYRLDIGAIDVAAWLILPVVFVGVAWLACLVPARRVARVDPNIALRE